MDSSFFTNQKKYQKYKKLMERDPINAGVYRYKLAKYAQSFDFRNNKATSKFYFKGGVANHDQPQPETSDQLPPPIPSHELSTVVPIITTTQRNAAEEILGKLDSALSNVVDKARKADELSVALAACYAHVELLEKRIAQGDTIIGSLRREIIKLQSQLDEANARAEETQTKLSERIEEINALKIERDELTAQYTNKLTILRESIASYEQQIKTNNETMRDLSAHLAEKENEILLRKQELVKSMANEADQERLVNFWKIEKKRLEDDKDAIATEMRMLRETNSFLERDLKSNIERVEQLEAYNNNLRSESRTTIDRLESRNAELENAISNGENVINSLRSDLVTHQQELSTLRGRIQSVETELQDALLKQQQLHDELDIAKTQGVTRNEENALLNAKVSELETKLERYYTSLGNLFSKVDISTVPLTTIKSFEPISPLP